MKLIAENFRAIKGKLDIDINTPLTIIKGMGHVGKSTLLKAFYACATGEAVPFPNLSKTKYKQNCKSMVNHDKKKASLSLDDRKISYPDGEVIGESPLKTLECDDYITDIKNEKDRSTRFSNMININPTDADITNALIKVNGTTDKGVQKIVVLINSVGMDSTSKQYDTSQKEKRGAWGNVTGLSTANRKDFSYLPEGWTPEHELITIKELTENVTNLTKFRDESIRASGFSEAEIKTLNETASKIPNIEKDIKDCQAEIKKATDSIDKNSKQIGDLLEKEIKLEKEYSALNLKRDQKHTDECPACKVKLNRDDSGSLVEFKPEKLTQKESDKITELEQSLDDVKNSIKSIKTSDNEFNAKINTSNNTLRISNSELTKSQEAQTKLNEKEDNKDSGERDLEKIESHLAEANKRLEGKQKKTNADKLSAEITTLCEIRDILGAKGIRKEKLIKSLDRLNKSLPFNIEVANDLSISMNERDYFIDLSKSEQKLCKEIMYMVESVYLKQNLCIIDDLDHVDENDQKLLINYAYKIAKSKNIKMLFGLMTLDGVDESLPESIAQQIVITNNE